jgi:tetratricopeptide (TPR) repeat protein
MLETIREFAAERLRESGEAAELGAVHANWVLAFAQETTAELHGPRQVEGLDRLEAELGNVRAALASTSPEGRLRLGTALSWFWQLKNHLPEGAGWLEQALREVEKTTPERARALGAAGRLAFYGGDAAKGRERLEESADLLQRLGDERDLAETLTYLGVTAGVVGDTDTALVAGERAVSTAAATGDDWLHALALWGLGMNYLLGRCGPPDAESAAPLLEQSVALFRKTGDTWGLAGPLFYLGRTARAVGDLDAAQRFMSESAALTRGVGEMFRLNLALHGLGDMALAQEQWSAAAAFYAEAVEVSRELGEASWLPDAQVKLALTELGEGKPADATELLREGLAGYRASGDAEGLLWVLEGFSHIAAQAGDPGRAAILLGASKTRHRGGGFDLEGRDQLEASVRDELGPDAFEDASSKGAAMTPETAIDYALAAG